jgi:hypothetical protein
MQSLGWPSLVVWHPPALALELKSVSVLEAVLVSMLVWAPMLALSSALAPEPMLELAPTLVSEPALESAPILALVSTSVAELVPVTVQALEPPLAQV